MYFFKTSFKFLNNSIAYYQNVKSIFSKYCMINLTFLKIYYSIMLKMNEITF